MFARLAETLILSRTNIPLRRFAYAARRCPPSKGEFLTPTRLIIKDHDVRIPRRNSASRYYSLNTHVPQNCGSRRASRERSETLVEVLLLQ